MEGEDVILYSKVSIIKGSDSNSEICVDAHVGEKHAIQSVVAFKDPLHFEGH